MERFTRINFKKFIFVFLLGINVSTEARTVITSIETNQNLLLHKQSGFFRFSFDSVSMPHHIQNMGLLGINYFADLTPFLYGGIGGYASIAGSQGGLFVLGAALGLHRELLTHWWGDAGFFAGGGGGRSSLVGGGLMLRPHVGIEYEWQLARLGLNYSYINFPSGLIRSQQVALDLDIPFDFYYVDAEHIDSTLFQFKEIHLLDQKYLDFQRNDFSLILQAYDQKAGTKNVEGVIQDGTIGLVGAELDHYITDHGFWFVKTSGAFTGIPNGYMDVLGGFGYHYTVNSFGLSFIPQLGAGAGGGGNVNTGGGVILQPQLGVELPLTSNFAARISEGYLFAPKGTLSAYTTTGAIIYHLNVATANSRPIENEYSYWVQGWRIQLFNQTYLHPQRTSISTTSPINLISVQIDQLFTPLFFFTYQGAFAYSGTHAGGYATGMVGPGLQTPLLYKNHLQLFTELLIGAGGGGNLALGGGATIEPVLGVHYALTPAIGLQTSVSQIKALHHDLNTAAFNIGLTLRFGTLNQE